MNPTNHFDANAPYRAAIQALADGYNCIPPTHSDRPSSSNQTTATNHRSDLPPRPPANASESSSVNLSKVVRAFSESGINYRTPISVRSFTKRLSEANLSPQLMLDTIHLMQQPNHPDMAALGISPEHLQKMLKKFSGAISSPGFNQDMINAIHFAENDPVKLVVGLYYCIDR